MIFSQQIAAGAAAACLALFIAAACYSDLKQRIVSNLLNLAAFQAASILYFSFAGVSLQTVFNYFSFVLSVFLFSAVLYELGVWAGGDAKYFTSLFSFYPIFHEPSLFAVPAAFVFSAVLFVPLLFLIYWEKIFRLKREVFQSARTALAKAAGLAPGAAAFSFAISLLSSAVFNFSSLEISTEVISLFFILFSFLGAKIPAKPLAVLFAASLFFNWQYAASAFAISFVLIFFISFIAPVFSFLSVKVLTKELPLSRLEEGMIPAESIFVSAEGEATAWRPRLPDISRVSSLVSSGKMLAPGEVFRQLVGIPDGRLVADALKARGLTRQEIAELKKLRGIKTLAIKESAAFAPVLSAGFLAALVLL